MPEAGKRWAVRFVMFVGLQALVTKTRSKCHSKTEKNASVYNYFSFGQSTEQYKIEKRHSNLKVRAHVSQRALYLAPVITITVNEFAVDLRYLLYT